MNNPLAIILLAAAILLGSSAAAQHRQRTTRPKAGRTEAVAAPVRDTLAAAMLDSLSLSGYDKPLRSRRESLFVTNRTPLRLTRLWLDITYRDTEGRQLHRRVAEAAADIPPGETRLVTFPSWDRQQSFVYLHSEQPRRSSAIPYTVEVTVERALTAQE